LGLDCDQETWDSSIEGLQADPFIADYAAIIRETVSSTPDKPRSRVLFILDQPITDSEQYRIAAEALIHKYGASDEHRKDPARLFFGRKNAHHVALGNILYRDVLHERVIEPYLKAKASNNGHSFAGPIPDAVIEGDRNKTLASLAGSMRRRGASEAAIFAALMEENKTRFYPPLEEDEVRGVAHSVMRYEPSAGPDGNGDTLPGDAEKEGRKSQATILVELLGKAECQLWHDPDNRPWATIPVGLHRENWSLGAGGFRRWLRRLFYASEGKVPGSQAVQDALGYWKGKLSLMALSTRSTPALLNTVGLSI
jgi:hypothetical protein